MSTAVFITARTGATRLPRKMLRRICGRTVLERVVTRLRAATVPDRIVVCTTAGRDDDELAALAASFDVDVYRGETDDILSRWLGACDTYGVSFFAACDGDDVLCDPGYVDRVLACHGAAEYVTCDVLPFGLAPLGIATAALRRVCATKTETDTAGQGRFFYAPDITRATIHAGAHERHASARLTLDYPKDAAFFDALLHELAPDDLTASAADIVALLNDRPDLVAINAGVTAMYWARFRELYPDRNVA
jgi:spore coat polysaccharide biosynthesis protein SpsF